MKNQITFFAVLALTIALSFFERNTVQIVGMILLFLLTGLLMKRKVLFAGIAIVVISFIFIVKKNLNIESGNDPKIIKKFNFSIGDDEE